ncbi:MAG: DUF4258 domain-containing protein [Gammaproteobacteria bacterium]|nr:DUF4258 domain-containing protein [Gammaproteobacteria bacterium]
MSKTLKNVQALIRKFEVRISDHGYDELSSDNLFARDVVEGAIEAIVVEDYPNYPKGPCVLVLQRDRVKRPIHIVWGIPKGYTSPAVLITAYRPDPEVWENDWLRRRK